MPSSAQLLAIAAHGLAGSRIDHPIVPLDDLEWFDLVQGCVAADLIGLLAAAAADGQVPVTGGQAEELAVLEAERTGLSRLVERRAATMASLLAAAAIDHRVIDGPARRLAYGDTAVRPFRSVQVLVPASRYHDAVALQGPAPATAGGQPVRRRDRLVLVSTLAGMWPDPDEARHSCAHESPAAVEPSEADLVGQLGPAATIELAGESLSVLSLEAQLVVACAQTATAPVAPLVQLRDLAQIALSVGLDSARARRLAEATGVAESLAAGVALAWSRFELADKTDLSVWALRMSGARSVGAPVRRAAPLSGGAGLAQRLLDRLPGAGLATVPTASSTTGSRSTGTGRSSRAARRSR